MGARLRVTAIVPAAGSGTRMGLAVPKQYLQLRGGIPIVLTHVSRLARSGGAVDEIIVSVPPGGDEEVLRGIS